MQTIEDYFHISHSMAKKWSHHPVYPDRDDFVQNSMVCLLKSEKAKKHPLTSIYFSHNTSFTRGTRWEADHYMPSLEDISEPSVKEKDLVDKIEIERFIDWLPKNRKQLFEYILDGESMKSIADKIGCSRQTIHNIKNKVIKDYQKYMANKYER